jgi:hypothetical protein
MLNEMQYLQSLLKEIADIKSRGGKSLFRVNDKFSESTLSYIKSYFNTKPEYQLEIKKCFNCKNTFDVIITFK